MKETVWVSVISYYDTLDRSHTIEDVAVFGTRARAVKHIVSGLANEVDYTPTGNWEQDLEEIVELLDQTDSDIEWTYELIERTVDKVPAPLFTIMLPEN